MPFLMKLKLLLLSLLLLLLQWLLAKRLRIMLNAYSFSQLSMMVRPCGVSTLSG